MRSRRPGPCAPPEEWSCPSPAACCDRCACCGRCGCPSPVAAAPGPACGGPTSCSTARTCTGRLRLGSRWGQARPAPPAVVQQVCEECTAGRAGGRAGMSSTGSTGCQLWGERAATQPCPGLLPRTPAGLLSRRPHRAAGPGLPGRPPTRRRSRPAVRGLPGCLQQRAVVTAAVQAVGRAWHTPAPAAGRATWGGIHRRCPRLGLSGCVQLQGAGHGHSTKAAPRGCAGLGPAGPWTRCARGVAGVHTCSSVQDRDDGDAARADLLLAGRRQHLCRQGLSKGALHRTGCLNLCWPRSWCELGRRAALPDADALLRATPILLTQDHAARPRLEACQTLLMCRPG